MARAMNRSQGQTPGKPGIEAQGIDLSRWVAEAAYYRAEHRGFSGGDPVEDWLAAEQEIGMRVGRASDTGENSGAAAASEHTAQQRTELAAYTRLRETVRKYLGEAQTVTADTLRKAFEHGKKDLKEAGSYAAKTITRVSDALRKDMESAMHKMGPRWESFSANTADLFEVWRDRGALFLAHAATAVGAWMEDAGRKLEHQTYETGEITSSGTFECTGCGNHIVMGAPGYLPLCINCRNNKFRRL